MLYLESQLNSEQNKSNIGISSLSDSDYSSQCLAFLWGI